MNENEEFEFRARAEKEAQSQRQPQMSGTKGPATSFQEFNQLSGLSPGQKVWQGLKIPAQMSERGLQTMANAVPEGKITGNLPMDLLRGTPRIAANTLAQAAPSFVNRGSLLGMGVLGGIKGLSAVPQIRQGASGLAGQLESLVGSPEGTLAKGFASAKNFFGPGKKAAQPFYKAAEETMPKGASVFEGMYKPEQIVDKAKEILSSGGKLEPTEGLTYRKAVDSLAKSGRYVKDEIFNMREEADAIAKGSRLVRKGDQIYQSGIRNQALRRPFPLTSTGKTATVKTGMMFVPGIGQALAPLFSPAIQGATATGLGALTRLPPELAALISSLLSRSQSQSSSQSQ